MGLFDFFKKGTPQPAATPKTGQPGGDFFNNNNAQPGSSGPAAETYTVKSGDSLSKIAKHLYGDMDQWHKIFEANKDQIKDPNLIYPGQQLRIPR